MGDRRFVVELIKPSHYDDDGYVIQWWKSWIPSNSLACLYGIATDLAERRALGPDVAIEIHAYDECHTVIPVSRIIRRIKGADAGLVCLVGVQSNQFPRAMDLAARFRAAGIQVAVGGFHVSGCLAMLPELPPDLDAARRARGQPVCRRGRGAARRGLCRCARRPAAADLQLHERPAGAAAAGHAVPAARHRAALRRDDRRLRRRARLPVPVQLLHDHQCAGAQIALARRRRCRAAGARQPRAGRLPLLHHRRQFRAQPQLGGDLRPPDRDARARGARPAVHHPGRHAVPPHPELCREGGARRLQAGLYRARKHQPRQSAAGQEKAEPGARIPPDVSRLAAPSGSSPMPAISSAFRATRRSGSRATSAPCSRNCRSTCSNFLS